MKKKYDLVSNFIQYDIGDQVWYYNPKRKIGRSSIFERPWKGPYKVIKKISNILYRIHGLRDKPRVVHHDKLKPYDC